MKSEFEEGRNGILIGVLASAFGLLISFILGWLGISFAPASAGQGIIEILPGAISIPLIELMHEWAKRLLIAAVLVGFLACGALAGRWAVDSRRSSASVAGLTIGPWVAALLIGTVFAGTSRVDLPSTLLNASVAALAQVLALISLIGSTPDVVAPEGRRRVLIGTAATLAVIASGGAFFGSGLRFAGTKLGDAVLVARRLKLKAEPTPEDPTFAAIGGLTPRLTPTEDHYVVDSALIKPSVVLTDWKLEIKGEVDRPFSLSYEDLLDLEAVEQLHTLECISNEIGGSLAGTSLWTGVPLRDLLDRAGVKSTAYDVIFRSVDDYTDSVPVAKALDQQTIVAYLMNGRTLSQEHGYPARLLIPDIYGMKNVKWIRTIEVATFDHKGYWQEQGWSDVATVMTNARIDVPRGGSLKWNGGPINVAGVAIAGSRGISNVEVSVDGGTTWQNATLEPALGSLTWRRWKISWTPPTVGTYRLLARATDGTGQLQTAVTREPFPIGATGYHQVGVNVQRG